VARVLAPCCALLLWASAVHADGQGPYFEARALPRPGYELRLGLRYHDVERTDFAAPVFLLPQQPRRIEARELRLELDLRLSVTSALAIQTVVPLSLREVDAELEGVLVSIDEQLPAQTLDLSSWGVSDPLLGAAYRFLRGELLAAYAEAGVRIALDDNPGALTLPTRVPLGTGQSRLYLGAGANLLVNAFDASLAYRFEYSPGYTATYLLRRTGPQSYTNGSLDSSIAHRVSASAGYAISRALSLRLSPEWVMAEQPRIVERDATFALLAERWLHEIAIEAELRWHLGEQHLIALSYRHFLLESWNEDPFFPIAIPERGVGLSWHVTGF
jgi:hypothetical protein